jgi:hypothetical protein
MDKRFVFDVMQLIRISITEEYFYFPHLVVLGRCCACEILIANPIDWIFAACLEYFICAQIKFVTYISSIDLNQPPMNK